MDIPYLTFDLGPRSHKMSHNTRYIMESMHLHNLKLLCQTICEKIQLQETRDDQRTDRPTTDPHWYEINVPYFSYEKAGKINTHFYLKPSYLKFYSI